MNFDYKSIWEAAGGKVPDNWDFQIIADLLENPKSISVGVMYPGNCTERGVPLVRVSDVKDGAIVRQPEFSVSTEVDEEYKRTKLSGSELLITLVGNPGDCVVVTEEMIGWNVARALAVVRLKDISLRPWLRYILLSKPAKHLIDARLNTTVQKTLNLKDIKELAVPMAPKKERDAIVEIATNIEKKLTLNRQINRTLEEVVQLLFKSWFVDFEPVKAKIAALGEGQDPNLAAMKVISGRSEEELHDLKIKDAEAYSQLVDSATVFPKRMKGTELGLIPEGWEVKPFGDCLISNIGGDWGKDEEDEKHSVKASIIRGTDLPNVMAGNDSGIPKRWVEPRKLKTRQLAAGDIVIEVSGGSKNQPTGRSLFLTKTLIERLGDVVEPASFCRRFTPLNFDIGILLGVHLTKIYADGKTWGYQNQSTGISNFQTKVFLERELVVLPNLPILESFSKKVTVLLDKIHGPENADLVNLRDTLLPTLLSGDFNINMLIKNSN